MTIELEKVTTMEAVNVLEPLIKVIWEETFIPIIGQKQVDYMLAVYQSKAEISRQIKENEAEYFLVFYEAMPVGYVAYRKEQKRLFISKIYLLNHYQGKGLATKIFAWIEETARANKLSALYLHVNQNNKKAIEIYEHKGFINSGEIITDIDEGFLMEDFIFVKDLKLV